MKLMMRIAITLFAVVVLDATQASEATCGIASNSPFCQYNGKVANLYVNGGGMILMYFDTPLNLATPTDVGLTGVTSTSAAALFRNSNNSDFADALYASLLAAQARDADITIQMYSVEAGYLIIDRIWVR